MPRILVTGATGYIGGRLVPRLLEKGYSVRCLARQPKNLEGRPWNDVEIVPGDVLKPESLDAAMRDVDVAFYLVHSMRAGEAGFEERDRSADRDHGFGNVFGDLFAEGFLESGEDLGGIEAVRAKVVDELGVIGDLFGVDSEGIANNRHDAFSNVAGGVGR